ncbi:MAG: anti-sigma factor antagonist [Firmicutes bacterium]|nr:anti-sigma factor antagonist [Bacillota bacterium]
MNHGLEVNRAMHVDLIPFKNGMIARVFGELDLRTAPEFRDTIDSVLDRQAGDIHSIILSMGGVTFLDSSGLGAILGRYRKLSQVNGRLAACSLTPHIMKVFELSGLLKIIQVFDTEERAVAALAGGGQR